MRSSAIAVPRGKALVAIGYVVLVVYGSLYPFSGWVVRGDPFAFLFRGWNGTQVSLGDVGTNVLAYVPVGFLFYRYFAHKVQGVLAGVLSIAAAFSLSLGMEVLQAFLPTRVQSIIDLTTNTLGGALGVMVARLQAPDGAVAERLRQARARWLVRGRLTDVGLVALAAWSLSWLMPLVPSLDVGRFRAALAPLAHVIGDPKLFDGWWLLAEALSWAGFALMTRSLVRPEKPGFIAFTVVVIAILLAQIPVVGHYLEPEVLLGSCIGLLIARPLCRLVPGDRANVAFFLIFAGFCVAENLPGQGGAFYSFNWIPFRPELNNTVVGIDSLLKAIGLAAALAWAARSGADPRTMRRVGCAAGILTVGGAFLLELNQRHVQGRVGDITIPLIMTFTFVLAWRWSSLATVTEEPHAPAVTTRPARQLAVPIHDIQRHLLGRSALFYLTTLTLLTFSIWVVTHLSFVNYNVRQLLYAGHPIRSAVLLSVSLFLTLAVPAWVVAWVCDRRLALIALPLALLVNALLAWTAVVNAVPSRNLHDIVGAPILHWPGETETCLRFLALHGAITLLVTGGAVLTLPLFQSRRIGLVLGWMLLSVLLGPLLHWAIVVQAATDNLVELMRDGGSAAASTILALAAVLSFLSGSVVSASIAFSRRRGLAAILAVIGSLAAYQLFVAGSEPVIIKYGKIFSAMQFLLSPDRAHYVGKHELIVRYIVAYLALVGTLALLQYRAWAAIATGSPKPNVPRAIVPIKVD